jgi:putative hemolysin/membrane-bound inhibitor of C-type lysozyme
MSPNPALRRSRNFAVHAITLLLGVVVAALTAHAQTPAPATGGVGLANPASTNCVAKGGKSTIEKNGKGDQFGVCTFADNRQCEEWALMRGECRAGGIRVTGYVTSAARYCPITGGTYKVKSASNTPNEQGSCRFKGGRSCDAWAYFNGSCTRVAATPVLAAAASIKATFRCADGKSINADFINGPASSVKLALSDGRTLDLPQARSGSGARYANAGETIVFWNKGNTAFIEEGGKTTFRECAT